MQTQQVRLVHIDILRGTALLGIFLVNMASYHSPINTINPHIYWEKGLDRFLYMLADLFAQASFYPIFAFLFGFGAIMLADRLGSSFPRFFTRRMIFLLAAGCIHAFLIWHGDILITYAVFGWCLLIFYKWKGKQLFLLGVLLYVLPFTVLSAGMILLETFGTHLEVFSDIEKARAVIEVYQQGSWAEILRQRFSDWYLVNQPGNLLMLFFSIFPFFLMGAGTARLKWLHYPKHNQRNLFHAAWTCLIMGLLLKSLPYWAGTNAAVEFMQDQLGGPLLSVFYISAGAMLFDQKKHARILHLFASAGRLSITFYLLQSILSVLLFYSYGAGLYGKISFSAGVFLALFIYCLLLAASHLWLRFFRMGPVEYLWRFVTYSKKPTFRRK